MSLLYDTGGNIGSIDVLVNSYDYFGRAVGNLTTQYQFNSECMLNSLLCKSLDFFFLMNSLLNLNNLWQQKYASKYV